MRWPPLPTTAAISRLAPDLDGGNQANNRVVVLCRSAPRAAMAESTQPRHCNCACVRCSLGLDCPSVRRAHLQGIVDAILVMVVGVIADQPADMFCVERDDMIQDLAAATAHPALRQAILPWRLDARPLRPQTRRLQELDDLMVEHRISIRDHITIWRCVQKRFAQLLDHPGRGGVLSDVEVQDAAAAMLDDEETVEQIEGHGRHRGKVECVDQFAATLKKRKPPLPRVTPAPK